MSLMTKPVKNLTADEKRLLFKPIGTSDLPYPASYFTLENDSQLKADIGILADDAHPLGLYADMPHEHVVGILYRDMAIPSLLHVQKEAMLRRALDSNNRLMAILGGPGSGKSHLAKMMGRICDTRGAELIDCGGRYMGDLLFEQVIDFGEDFKSALQQRVLGGNLSAPSVKLLEEQFPDALVKDDNQKLVGLDWDKIGLPKNTGSAADIQMESSEQAVERSIRILHSIAGYEGIPLQAVNTVGVRKQPGALIRAWIEGRELVLDEYTKSIEGSDDSLQSVLQFLSGEPGFEETTVENSMKVNGRQETFSFTFRRADMKPGFFVTMTGNKENDGFSTHGLSVSANSRIKPFTIEAPLAIDWKHRISQILTGLPLTTLYAVFSNMATEDAEAFADTMIELRLMGLSPAAKAAVPPHQITLLKNWSQTIDAVTKLADFYGYWSRIVDPNSDLYDPAKTQNANNIKNILPEVSATFRDESAIDFREVIQSISESLKLKPPIRKIEDKSKLRLNFAAVGKPGKPAVSRPEIVSAELGTRMESVLLERIGVMTAGRPKLQEALLKEGKERGVLSSTQDSISTLLNQDMFSDMGGTGSVLALRDTLISRMRMSNPALTAQSDDDLMPLDQAASICEELGTLSEGQTQTPRQGNLIMLSQNPSDPFNHVAAIDGASSPTITTPRPDVANMVSTADFMESLTIPALAKINMSGLWRTTISAEQLVPRTSQYQPIIELAEGRHHSKLGITTLMMKGANGNETPVHIVVDGERQKSLIVTDSISDDMLIALAEDYNIVTYDDPKAEERISYFLSTSLQLPSRKNTMAELERTITNAFMLRAGDERHPQPLAKMMSNPQLPTEAPIYITRKLA